MESKGDRYATISDIQTSVTTKLKTIPITDFLPAIHRWKIAPTCVLQLMVFTSNKKKCLEFFDFFWWFSKQSLKTYGTHCVYHGIFSAKFSEP